VLPLFPLPSRFRDGTTALRSGDFGVARAHLVLPIEGGGGRIENRGEPRRDLGSLYAFQSSSPGWEEHRELATRSRPERSGANRAALGRVIRRLARERAADLIDDAWMFSSNRDSERDDTR